MTIVDPSLFVAVLAAQAGCFYWLGSFIEKRRSQRRIGLVYVLVERAKVVAFTPGEFDEIARPYRATTEQRHELVEALMVPPPLKGPR